MGATLSVAVLLLGAVVCRFLPETESTGELPTQVPGGPQAEANPRLEEVTVYDDRVEPRQLRIEANAPVRLRVTSRSREDCSFFVGDYLTGLAVAVGRTEEMRFTVPLKRDAPSVTAAMGCEGDPDRHGAVVVENTGIPLGPEQQP